MIPVLLSSLALLAVHPQSQAPDLLVFQTASGVPVRVIRIDLTDPRVRVTVQTAGGFPHGAEPFEALLHRSRPTVAINGAYFSKEDLAPIGDIVVEGRVLRRGMMGTALAITRDNRAIIRRVRWGHAEDWSDYDTVLGCGPALVLDGEIDVLPTDEGFHDPHVMGAVTRMGVGITPDRHLLFVHATKPVSFRKWAEIMKALGCRDAMNLDAGASLAMHYRGKTLLHPGRNLTNLLLVHVSDKLATTTP